MTHACETDAFTVCRDGELEGKCQDPECRGRCAPVGPCQCECHGVQATGFGCVVADPPWPYGNANSPSHFIPKPLEGPGKLHKADGSESKSVNAWTYEPMPLSEIKALPVGDWAATDAHLWLWTTNAFMAEAYEVVAAWGFTPKTILTWGKVKSNDHTTPSMKVGYYLRGATEHAILAVRGRTPKPVKAHPTLLLTPRIQTHSSKPDEFFAVAESVSPGPRLEMFARTSRLGWTAWGDQAPDGVR